MDAAPDDVAPVKVAPDDVAPDDVAPDDVAHVLPHLTHCLNCGTPVSGNFCAHCGQENEDQTVAVRLLVSDALAEFASFDSKLLRTLVPLLIRPGFLTNQYNAGKRVRYVSPLKLYLTTSLLFFLVLPWIMPPGRVHLMEDQPTRATTGKIRVAKADRPAAIVVGESVDLETLPKTVSAYTAQQRDPRNRHKDSRLKQSIIRQIIKLRQDPQHLQDRFLDTIPKMMFFLVPLSAMLLKLLYWRRLYIEHLIFLLHCHGFAFLILTLVSLHLPRVLCQALGFYALVYFFLAMKQVYKQSWGKTLFKFCLFSFNYAILIALAVGGTALAAFFLF